MPSCRTTESPVFREMPRLTRGRPASNCTESQIVVRNRTALRLKHRNDSRYDLDIGFLIDRDPGAGMDCRKTNTSSGNRRKSVAAYSDCRWLSCLPGSQKAPRFLDDGHFEPYTTSADPHRPEGRRFLKERRILNRNAALSLVRRERRGAPGPRRQFLLPG